eukprot:1153122-Pelagomonas_calceolata.AAC.1
MMLVKVVPPAAVPQKAEQSSCAAPRLGPTLAAFAVSALLVLPQPSTAAMQLPNKEADNDSPVSAHARPLAMRRHTRDLARRMHHMGPCIQESMLLGCILSACKDAYWSACY